MSKVLLALLAALATAAPAAAGDLAVRLVDVPPQLAFPLPAGSNQVLTALVKGGPARSVWLAADEKAIARVMLVKVDEGEWQVNLGEPAVLDLANGAGGAFRVFAEAEDGKIAASLPVRYELRAVSAGVPSIAIVGTDGATKVEGAWDAGWLDPAKVARLEARWIEPPATRVVLDGRAGGRRFAFDEAGRLEMADDVRRAWADAGRLEVTCTPALGRPETVCHLHAIPVRLDFPGNVARLTVAQRSAEMVPGSRDYLALEIGDVTRGEALVTIRTATGEPLVSSRLLRERDEIAVPLAAETYHILVERLVNLLAGNDYAVFRISALAPAERAAVERLLAALEGAATAVVIAGKEEPPATVRARFEQEGPRVASAAEFVDAYGEAAVVKLREGGAKTLAAWWREQLAR